MSSNNTMFPKAPTIVITPEQRAALRELERRTQEAIEAEHSRQRIAVLREIYGEAES